MSNRPPRDLTQQKMQIMNSFIDSSNLGAFVGEVAKILHNPALLINANGRVLEYSHSHGVDDILWNTALTKGQVPDVLIRAILDQLAKSPSPPSQLFIDKNSFNNDYDLLVNILIHDHQLMGMLLILEMHQMVDTHPDLRQFISHIILKELTTLESSVLGDYSRSTALLTDLLQGNIHQPNALAGTPAYQDYFQQYHAFKLFSTSLELGQRSHIPALLSNLKAIFPWGHFFNFQNQILGLLSNNNEVQISNYELEALQKVLTSNSLFACLSDAFDDLLLLPEYFHKNERIIDIAKRMQGSPLVHLFTNQPETLLTYEDFAFSDMALLAARQSPLGLNQFICTTVREILKYDQENHTEYLLTLWHFMNSKQSCSLTAKKLGVHKNTILYRMNRFKELFDLDLDHLDSLHSLYNSCQVVLLQELLQGSQNNRIVSPYNGLLTSL